MTVQTAGQTTHFIVQYNDSIPTALGVANALLGSCEFDVFKMSMYMLYVQNGKDPFVDPQIQILLVNDPAHGAPCFNYEDNNGYSAGRQSVIRINPLRRGKETTHESGSRFTSRRGV